MSKIRTRFEQDLVDATEIAARYGLSKHAVWKWIREAPGFPTPAIILSIGNLYRWSEVDAWHQENRA